MAMASPVKPPASGDDPDRRQLIEGLRHHSGQPSLTDAQIEAELERARSDIERLVVTDDGHPEMTARLALARLRSEDIPVGWLPPPTYY